MNAERLHVICKELQQEIKERNFINSLQEIVNALQRIVEQPQQPDHQNALTRHLNGFYEALSDTPSDSFSPAWRQTLEEIGGSDLLGKRLAERVRSVIERNQITPASALEEIREILKALQQFKDAVDKLISGFSTLNVGAEELEPGECELGVLVPRKAVENNLELFGKELREISFIFSAFSELASGKRENYQIKAISSTDLSVFLLTVPSVAACVAYAAEKVVDLYKKLLEIKKIKGELKALGLKGKSIKGITDHANSFMKEEIPKIATELANEFYVGQDEARKNELRNAVQIALYKVANRIDQGYNIEVRAKPLPAPEEGEEAEVKPEDEQISRHLAVIKEASQILEFLKEGDERILHLPEKVLEEKQPADKK